MTDGIALQQDLISGSQMEKSSTDTIQLQKRSIADTRTPRGMTHTALTDNCSQH